MSDDLEWKPAETAPYGCVVWVRNSQMGKPVLASRGYIHNGMVHKDNMLFTTHYTPDSFFPVPSGHMVCPDEWAEQTEGERNE